MSHLSDELLQAIKARCDAATPGPYKVAICGYLIISKGDERYPEGQSQMIVADTINFYNPSFAPIAKLNAMFFAHARTDIPALLAHIEHLQRRYTMPCPYCDFGSGQRGMDRCPHCDGSWRMDVHAFIAQQRDVARAEVEGLRAKLAKAEAAKAALVRALEDIAERFLFQSSDFDSITLTKTDDIHIRAVLVRVKRESCPKN